MVRGEPKHGFERDVPVEAPIVSEDKLVEIRVDVLAAQPMIGAEPPAFHQRENSMNPGQHDMAGHLADRPRVVSVIGEPGIRSVPIGEQRCSGLHVGPHKSLDRSRRVVRDSGETDAPRPSVQVFRPSRWEMRSDNPCRGLERNTEEKRNRYLAGDELRRLTEALAVHPNQAAANAIRLLLLTGARRGEVLGATWDQFDLEEGIWTKAASFTKQKKLHRVPLSAPARQLLAEIKAAADKRPGGESGTVAICFSRPADRAEGRWPLGRDQGPMGRHLQGGAAQRRPCARSEAFLRLDPSERWLSLPVIGALLGHTQPGTTARYAHLFDDPLRAATERVGAIVTGNDAKPAAEVIELNRR